MGVVQQTTHHQSLNGLANQQNENSVNHHRVNKSLKDVNKYNYAAYQWPESSETSKSDKRKLKCLSKHHHNQTNQMMATSNNNNNNKQPNQQHQSNKKRKLDSSSAVDTTIQPSLAATYLPATNKAATA